MSKIGEWPVLPDVPGGGYVVVTAPSADPSKSVFAKVLPGVLDGSADLSHALLDDLAGDAGGPGGSGVGEAPTDGALYGRKNAGWALVPGAGALDLRSYGAVCDGSTDDTPAFNAAVAALPAAGGKLLIPDNTTLGNAVVSKSVTLEGLGGANAQATIRPLSGTVATVLDISAPFVTLSDLAISPATPTTQKQTAGTYINVRASANRFRAERITLTEFREGITLAGAMSTCELRDLRGYLYSTGLGQSTALIHIQGGLDVKIDGVSGAGPGTDTVNCNAGIWIENVGDAIITSVDVMGMGTGLLVTPGNGQSVTSLWVSNSLFDTGFRGVDLTPSGTGAILRSRFSDVWASSNATQGFRISSGVDGLDIDSPHVLLNGGGSGAIQLGTGVKNVRIRGGQIAGNNSNGVWVAAAVSDWSVESVTIGTTGGIGPNVEWGVFVVAGASDRYIIRDNLLTGNTLGSVSDAGTGTHKTVISNVGGVDDYVTYRDSGTGFLSFSGRQTNFSGYRFLTDDGTLRATLKTGLALTGGLGAFGTAAPAAKPNVTGSRAANAALASLLTALAAAGLISDGTSA